MLYMHIGILALAQNPPLSLLLTYTPISYSDSLSNGSLVEVLRYEVMYLRFVFLLGQKNE